MSVTPTTIAIGLMDSLHQQFPNPPHTLSSDSEPLLWSLRIVGRLPKTFRLPPKPISFIGGGFFFYPVESGRIRFDEDRYSSNTRWNNGVPSSNGFKARQPDFPKFGETSSVGRCSRGLRGFGVFAVRGGHDQFVALFDQFVAFFVIFIGKGTGGGICDGGSLRENQTTSFKTSP